MEPKNLLMDLTKKAIQAKPDDNYELKIVGTAVTAKAGYFELYKHRPHILFLDPELEDEDGLSFIYHALERMPYLKIVVMTSRLQEEEAFLNGGAHAIAQVPIQRASLWRKLDQLIEEADSDGLLDVPEYSIDEDESPSTPAGNLFQLEDPSENHEYNPIFEGLRKPSQDAESDSTSEADSSLAVKMEDDSIEEGEESDVVADDTPTEGFVILEEEVSVEDDMVEQPAQEPQPRTHDDLLIIDDDEPAILDWAAQTTQEEESDEEDEEKLAVFDPFALSTDEKEEENDMTENTSSENLFTFIPAPIENQEPKQESDEVKDETPSDNPVPLFNFDVKEPEDLDIQEEVSSEIEQDGEPEPASDLKSTPQEEPIIPLFDFEPNDKEEKEMSVDDEPALEENPQFELPLFKLEKDDSPSPSIDHSIHLGEVKITEVESPQPLFQFDIESKENEVEDSFPQTRSSEYKDGSNRARTKISLYSEGREYNKSTLKERHSFETGFYTRNGDFVPLYPPRELFARSNQANFSKADIEPANVPAFDHPQEPKSEEGLFSSVKKLFKRR